MIRKKIERYFLSELPAYQNGTLSPLKRRLVARWLDRSDAGQATLTGLHRLRAALAEEERAVPAVAWNKIRAQIQTTPQPAATDWQQVWGAGMAFLIGIIAIIWFALPPGIVLEWSVQGSEPEAFLVYRAATAEAASFEELDFALIDQLPADGLEYRFMDLQLLPGQEYVYRVEAIGAEGQPLTSEIVVGDALQALPGQVAILIAMLILGYGLLVFAQQRRPTLTFPLPA